MPRKPKQTPAPPPPPPPVQPQAPADPSPQGVAAQWVHVSQVRPWDKNPRVNDDAVPSIVASIREWGFPSPMVVWPEEGLLVAGHTRLKAMEAILAEEPGFVLDGAPGPGFVPVRLHAFKSRSAAQAYAVADNRLGENARWDDALLHAVAQEIMDEEGIGYLTTIGFNDDEIGTILADLPIPPAADGAPVPPGAGAPTGPTGPRDAAPTPPDMRLVQLVLDEAGHAEYLALLAELARAYGVTEPADVVLRALRAAREAA